MTMDVAALLTVSGNDAIGEYGDRGYYAAPVSTDLEEALRLARCADVTVSMTYRPHPTERMTCKVSFVDREGEQYEGDGVHCPGDDYRDPEDVRRGLDEPEDEPDGGYHQCGKTRCMADALVRALLMMFTLNSEELEEA